MIALVLAAFLAAGAPGPAELREAVRANDVAGVRALLGAGVDANIRDALGATPLHDAVWNGYIEVARVLLEFRADVNARHTEAGSTPLHYAVIKNEREIAELLLEHGADVRATYRSGETALHLAADR